MDCVLVATRRLRRITDGQDLLEYGLLTALIALAAIAGVGRLGNTVNAVLWQTIAQNF